MDRHRRRLPGGLTPQHTPLPKPGKADLRAMPQGGQARLALEGGPRALILICPDRRLVPAGFARYG
ncbi:hypothetical protein Q4543_05940 [Salipiger sp. 1_MG-2023]|uniref:hypothetical protein n=1 Tax=Salipiger sp. 1_MG-2023 TaxID=3062665 RepID=UPI0026E243DC|nr:hypothetical protein [Salipiger sp. 1_MG-2023]MDO6585052.1 hypothetical protein [Salipiger sp. 1_MG-2023]